MQIQIDFSKLTSINLPTSIDWLNAALVSLTVAIVSGTILEFARERINVNRAMIFISGIIIFDLAAVFVWYNVIGYMMFNIALDLESSTGCLVAIPTFKQALSWNPKISELRSHIINCYITVERPSKLLALVEPIEQQSVDDWYYWAEVTLVNYAKQDYQSMVQSADKSANLSPLDTNWITSLAEDLHRVAVFEPEIELLRIVRTNNPFDKNALFWLGWALYESGYYSDALSHFDKCIGEFGKGYEAGRCWAGKGFAYERLGGFSEAKNAFSNALSVWPNQQDVSLALSSLH